MAVPLHAAAALGISLRPETEEDRSFVQSLFVAVRAPEFAALGWPEEALAAFLGQQADLQSRAWSMQFPALDRQIVCSGGEGVGRIYTLETATEIALVDISLTPEERGAGIGTALLTDLVAFADEGGRETGLWVEAANPARRLYERHGFIACGEAGTRVQMRRPPRGG
jgi:GNAT superfamily N-acetyltransferase